MQRRLEIKKSMRYGFFGVNRRERRKTQITLLRRKARQINPPKRVPIIQPVSTRPLVNRLVAAQNIGKAWVPIIKRMVKEGMLSLKEKTDLRLAIARRIRPFNKAAARDFAQGKALYLQRGNKSIEQIFRTASSKHPAGVTVPTLSANEKAKRVKEFLRKLRGY